MDNTISNEHVSFIIAQAQRKQLENPTRAVVNSESAFVAQRLRSEGYFEIAAAYWSWVCNRHDRYNFSQEVIDLQLKLKAIDMGVSMPAWGTYGT